MRGVYLFCFVVILPALAALGHDIWYAFTPERASLTQPFYFTDLGWLWLRYAPDSFGWLTRAVDADIWEKYFKPVMAAKSAAVLAIPAFAAYAVLFVLRVFAFWPFARLRPFIDIRPRQEPYTFEDVRPRKKKIDYKRKN